MKKSWKVLNFSKLDISQHFSSFPNNLLKLQQCKFAYNFCITRKDHHEIKLEHCLPVKQKHFNRNLYIIIH